MKTVTKIPHRSSFVSEKYKKRWNIIDSGQKRKKLLGNGIGNDIASIPPNRHTDLFLSKISDGIPNMRTLEIEQHGCCITSASIRLHLPTSAALICPVDCSRVDVAPPTGASYRGRREDSRRCRAAAPPVSHWATGFHRPTHKEGPPIHPPTPSGQPLGLLLTQSC